MPEKFAKLIKTLPAGNLFEPAALARCALVMAATLACYAVALAAEHWEHQHVGLVVLAVALTVMLARAEIARPSRWRWLALLLFPAAAAAASDVGQKMARADHVGDVLFALALGSCIAVRRLGPGWSKAGAIVTLPFVTALVTPFTTQGTASRALWSAAIAFAAAVLTIATVAIARRLRLVAAAAAAPPAGRTRGRLRPSDRLAVQMAVAVGAAFVAGRHFHSDHWQWPVLTAFIVCSGNAGRGDVVLKGLQRAAGAAAGTAAATMLAGYFGAGNKTAVVIIFCILTIAVWLRPVNYAYWAVCITAALALIYGYFGQGGTTVMEQRLEGIAIGAAIGIGVSWFLLPIRTIDVLLRRAAVLLEVLTDLLAAIRDRPAAVGRSQVRSVAVAAAAVDGAAKPIAARAWVAKALRKDDRLAALPGAAAACRAPARALVELTRTDCGLAARPAVAPAHAAVLANVGLVRQSLVSRVAPDLHAVTEGGAGSAGPAGDRAVRALASLSAAVGHIAEAVSRPGPEGRDCAGPVRPPLLPAAGRRSGSHPGSGGERQHLGSEFAAGHSAAPPKASCPFGQECQRTS